MKDLLKTLGLGTAFSVAYCAGFWLWENVLEDKVEDLRDYIQNKRTQED